MSNIPKDLLYTETHEWVRKEADGSCTVGITDHAQSLLGDLVFIEPPAVNSKVKKGAACCTIESVKAASDAYAPISGTVIESNANIASAPETVNKDPYKDGWLFKIKPSDKSELDKLLTADAYEKIAAESHH